MNAAQPFEASGSRTIILQRGQDNLFVIPDNDKCNFTQATYQNGNLSANFMGKIAEVTREFYGKQKSRWDSTSVKIFKPSYLIGLQAFNISKNLFQ